MINAMLKAQWAALRRDRLALFLQFVLPVIFFSVFAFIFGGTGGSGSSQPAALRVAVLDMDESETSAGMFRTVSDMSEVNVRELSELLNSDGESSDPVSADTALKLVRNNTVDAAIIFPEGLEASIGQFGSDNQPAIRVIYDSANPLAQNMLTGVLQGAAFTAAPTRLIENGFDQFQQFGGAFSEQQKAAVDQLKNMLQASNGSMADNANSDGEASTSGSPSGGLVRIESEAARKPSQKKSNRSGSIVAYYAASVAVMFLMFSMAGAASALLEHQEHGTLERLISGRMSIAQLVISHWLFFVIIGVLQLAVMFAFAVLVFRVDISSPPVILGTALMSVITAMASASFVLLLATLCRSRKQLESISTTVILVMSAFGGSMVPRPFLPPLVKDTSNLTFNGWALDGFLKVLWYYDPTQNIFVTLKWHIAIILGMAAAFLWLATRRARRWAVA